MTGSNSCWFTGLFLIFRNTLLWKEISYLTENAAKINTLSPRKKLSVMGQGVGLLSFDSFKGGGGRVSLFGQWSIPG